MDDIIHVRPHNQYKNRIIEPLITPTPYVTPISPVAIQIPISTQVDINQILQENTAKFDTDTKTDLIKVDELSLTVQKYVPIGQMAVDNYFDQISLVVFTHFKLDAKPYIELLFNQFINRYQWSLVKNFDSITVLLKPLDLIGLQTLHEHSRLFDLVSDKMLINSKLISLSLDEQVVQLEINETKITQLIKDLIEKNKNEDKSSIDVTSNNASLANYYNNYPVDANELIDVPKLMKSRIINELIKFRSKMLVKEHQKRQSELTKERIKAKQLLSSIFNNDMKDSSKQGGNDDYDNTSTLEPPEEMNELNDAEYEEYLQQNKERELSNRYTEKLRQIAHQKLRKNDLVNKIKQSSQYEMNLINNKMKLIDNSKASSQTYHDYMKYKFKVYQSEEIRDNEDRELEKLEQGQFQGDDKNYKSIEEDETSQQQSPSKNTEQDQTPSFVNKDNEKVEEDKGEEQHLSSVQLVSMPSLDNEQKTALHEKLASLVEQYIGIKEDELIQYLFDNLLDNNLSRDEVYETFDNDTDNLINDINQFINTLTT